MADSVIQRAFVELDARTSGFEQKMADAKQKAADFTEFIQTKPQIAAGAMVLALAAVAAAATRMAADVDLSMRKLQAALPDQTTNLSALRHEITLLSTETPRTQVELADLATQIAKLGEHDPKQIAENMRAIALAGDALGQTDLLPLADALDQVQDGFGLTGAEARKAFVQIVNITKGRIGIDELASTLGKAGTKLASFNIDAVQAAHALATLIDAGVNSRQITTGVVELLDKAAQARREAIEARQANKEGDAKALDTFARVVNKVNIESKGLVTTLGDLFRAFDGNRAAFYQAGLNANDFQIAQKAAEASTAGVRTEVDSYATSLRKLGAAAEVNRNSAQALSTIIKNELSATLIDLGNTILPTVITVLQRLEFLLSSTRRGASAARDELAKLGDAQKDYDAKKDGTRWAARSAVKEFAVNQSERIVQNPAILRGMNSDELTRNYEALARALNATGANRILDPAVLAQIKDAMKLLAKEGLGQMDANAKGTAKSTEDTGTAFENTGAKAAAAAERFDALVQSMRDFAASTEDAADPMRSFNERSARMREDAEKLIATLAPSARAEASNQLARALAEIADAGDRLRTSKAAELVAELNQALLQASGDALDAINAEYDALEKTQRLKLEQLEKAGPQYAKEADAIRSKLLPLYARQRAALVEVAQTRKEFDQYSRTIETFFKTGSAGFTGTAVTVAEYKRAVQQLGEEQRRLEAITQDTTASEKERAAALELLNDIIKKRNDLEAQGAGTADQTAKGAEYVMQLGDGLEVAAQNALALAQAVGQGTTRLGGMLAGVVSLGRGMKELGALAQNAGGFSELFSTGAGAASAIGPITAIVGGVKVLADAFDIFGTRAKQKARELHEAALRFDASLREFVDAANGGLSDVARAIKQQNDDYLKVLDGFRQKYSENTRFSEAAYKERELIESAHAASIKRITSDFLESLGNDLLAAQGNDTQAKLNEAQAKYAETLRAVTELSNLGAISEGDYARALEMAAELLRLTTDQINEQNAAKAREASLNALNERARITGQKGADFLTSLVDEFGKSFDALGGILDGLIVDGKLSEAGLQTLRERAASIFDALAVDGITDAEQEIIDALLSIVSSAEGAVTPLETVADKIAKALGTLSLDNEILGGSASARFDRLKSAAGPLSEQLAALLGDIDLSTTAGADAARQKLRDLYVSLAADGLTDSERAVVDLIRQLLGGIDDVVNEGLDNAATTEEKARTARQRMRDAAQQDIELGDLTGVDAFRSILKGYGDGFSALLGSFDVSSSTGVDDATNALRALLASVRDGTADLAAFGGMTRDEIIDAILDLDGALDGLGDSAKDSAEALLRAAQAQADFVDSVNVDYLRATGQDKEADIKVLKADIAAKIKAAKDLGLGDDIIQTIIRTGDAKLKALNDKYEKAAQPAPVAETPSATTKNRQTEFVASAVTQITSLQALRITDYLASSLIEQRSARVGIEALVRLMSGALGVSLATLAPALSSGVGGIGGGGGAFQLIVNFNGPLTGIGAGDAAEQFIAVAGPQLDAYLARQAGINAKVGGRTIT